MRRGMPATTATAEMRPSYRSTTSGTSSAVPGSGTILVNLDVFIQRATVGHDISPLDEDLIVLFRRNSKEITSEPTRWHSDHVAEWNQHVGIQTSLLRGKRGPNGTLATEFLKKEYEVVLVALPSHSAVALFTVDFADLVQPANPVRHKVYRIAPLKCRDLAAVLEFEIVWDYAVKQPVTSTGSVSIAGLPPASLLSTLKPPTSSRNHSHNPNLHGYPDTASSISSRRTTASMSSANSDRDPLADLVSGSTGANNCTDCRASKRRLERKEMQILQLETFLKESQKRLDSLAGANDELALREQAETTNALQYKALTARLVQELEMAFQFCALQVVEANDASSMTSSATKSFMFLPQFEFMERVKQLMTELEAVAGPDDDAIGLSLSKPKESVQQAWQRFDFRREMRVALERNQRLQQQLAFLGRALAFESNGDASSMTQSSRLQRTDTATSGDTIGDGNESVNSLDDADNDDINTTSSRPAFTMTEQLNNLERENFGLKAKLERALADLKAMTSSAATIEGGPTSDSDTGDSHSSSSRVVHDDIDEDDIDDVDVDVDDDVNNIAALHLELERAQDAITQLEQTNACVRSDNTRLASELVAAQTTIDSLEHRVAEATSSMTSSTEPPVVDQSPAAAAPGFLNKIYQDVGKAKLALEEKVKQLNLLLRHATDENLQLRAAVEALEAAAANEPVAPAATSDRAAADREWVAALEQQVAALQATLDDSSNRLAARDHDYAILERDLATCRTRIRDFETQIETLTAAAASTSSMTSSNPLTSNGGNDRSDDVIELTKQLKLAKQEVMQLRYRSNQIDSVNERLDDALKEKRTLEVKLTALEGQLFDHRSRTISDNSFATDQSTLVAELQKQLDQRASQLLTVQRELESVRREQKKIASITHADRLAGNDDTINDLSHKVAAFESQIAQLMRRIDVQTQQLEAVDARVARVQGERNELEAICHELVQELDAIAQRKSRSNAGASSEPVDSGDLPRTFAPVAVPMPPLSVITSTGKVTDRYASALATTSADSVSVVSKTPVAATHSKVAHLIKNFSNSDDVTTDGRPSDPVTPVKRVSKFDFRTRNGSSASGSSSVTDAMRFRSGTASSAARE